MLKTRLSKLESFKLIFWPMLLKRISLLFILFLAFAASPAHAQGATPQPVVRAVLFTNPLCKFCRQIVEIGRLSAIFL